MLEDSKALNLCDLDSVCNIYEVTEFWFSMGSSWTSCDAFCNSAAPFEICLLVVGKTSLLRN